MIEGFHSYDSIASDYSVDLNNTTYDESTVVLRFDNGGSLTLHLEGELNRHDETQTPIIYTADGEPINLFSGTIYGNDYEDYIDNDKDNVTIEALGGDDDIDNFGSEVLINAGNGNDFIQLEGSFESTISGGAGNDTITGFDFSNNLIIEGDYEISFDGESTVTVTTSGGSVTLKVNRFYYDDDPTTPFIMINNEAVPVTSSPAPSFPTDGDDYYENSESNVKIDALAGNDTIINSGSNVTINAGAPATSPAIPFTLPAAQPAP